MLSFDSILNKKKNELAPGVIIQSVFSPPSEAESFGLLCAFGKAEKNSILASHYHSMQEFVFVINGHISIKIMEGRHDLKNYDTILVPTECIHEATFLEPTQFFAFFSSHPPDRILSDFPAHTSSHHNLPVKKQSIDAHLCKQQIISEKGAKNKEFSKITFISIPPQSSFEIQSHTSGFLLSLSDSTVLINDTITNKIKKFDFIFLQNEAIGLFNIYNCKSDFILVEK